MVKKQSKKVKQQASLFTFFGKNKKKRSSDNDNCNDDETVHDKPASKQIKLSADSNNVVDTVVNNGQFGSVEANILAKIEVNLAHMADQPRRSQEAPCQDPASLFCQGTGGQGSEGGDPRS